MGLYGDYLFGGSADSKHHKKHAKTSHGGSVSSPTKRAMKASRHAKRMSKASMGNWTKLSY